MSLYVHVNTFVCVVFLGTLFLGLGFLWKLKETFLLQNLLIPVVLNLWPGLEVDTTPLARLPDLSCRPWTGGISQL